MLEDVRTAVESLKVVARDLDPLRLDGRCAATLFEAAGEGERLCAAIKALLARRIEETKVWREGGHRSAAHWVAEATGETVGAATRALETARALEQSPETDAAFRAGQLSATQAAEITSAAGCAPETEGELLEIDHVIPLEQHGRTELANLWRLCSHHHRLKTYAGWKVVDTNGTRDLVPPDHPDPP